MKMFNGKEFDHFYIKDIVSEIKNNNVHFLKTSIILPLKCFDEEVFEGKEMILKFDETEDNQESFRNLWQTCSYYICDKDGNYEVDLPYNTRPNKTKKKRK